jgi:hypothetical protein
MLDYVHADLWGPSHKKSLGGASYMHMKSLMLFESGKLIEKQTERKVKLLHTIAIKALSGTTHHIYSSAEWCGKTYESLFQRLIICFPMQL